MRVCAAHSKNPGKLQAESDPQLIANIEAGLTFIRLLSYNYTMESLPERLRALTENKYFAYIAVVFFAFLTALIFAILAYQSTFDPAAQQGSLQQDSRTNVSGNGRFDGTSGSGPASSPDGTSGSTEEPMSDPGDTTQPSRTDGSSQTKPQSALDRIIAIITGRSPGQSTSDNQADSENQQNSGTARQTDPVFDGAQNIPDITIEKFTLATDYPRTPASVKMYRLKKNYSEAEISDFARALGFAQIDAVEKEGSRVNMYDLDNKSIVSFRTDTGYFTYLSQTGFTPSQNNGNLLQMAKTTLSDLGIDDATIRAHATYERSDDNGEYVYAELHRDWRAFGSPILNPIGMLNLLETDDVGSLSLGQRTSDASTNIRILNSSDRTDGTSRPNDFNTITVKFGKTDGKIYGISSNMPVIADSETISGAAFKSPEQAYSEYTGGSSSMGIVGPSGDGAVNIADAYSNNIAQARSVNVTDFELFYASQQHGIPDWWCPSYGFRSYGQVQTGYESQFVHTVPAIRDSRCDTAVLGESARYNNSQDYPSQNSRNLQAQAAGQVTVQTTGVPITPITGKSGSDDAASLQYGTLTFITRITTKTPVNDCPPSFTNSYKIADTQHTIEYLAWIDPNVGVARAGKKKPRKWYHVIVQKADSTAELTSLSATKSRMDVMNIRSQLLRECTIGNASDCPKDPNLETLATFSCEYVTTASPWIYLYPQEEQQVVVSPDPVGSVAYASPSLDYDASWSVTAQPDGQLTTSTGLRKNALFWEYYTQPVLKAYLPYINVREDAFIVPSHELSSFMAELTRRIGLNQTEQSNVLAELNRPSLQTDKPYVSIRFVSQDFLSKHLPLRVSPQPDSVHRIFFEITPLSHPVDTQAPALPTIIREGFTVVETGFIAVK